MLKKDQKRERIITRSKQPIQQHSISRSNIVKPIFKDIPLSNFDLLEWVKYLKIPNFKGIYSRNSLDHFHNKGCCIINLDDKIGSGTHWVAEYIKPPMIYYFDSFSIHPPLEFIEHAKRLNMQYVYNYGYPIQDIYSVRCGYYCLYFLDNIGKKSFYNVLKVFKIINQQYNEDFIKKYFI